MHEEYFQIRPGNGDRINLAKKRRPQGHRRLAPLSLERWNLRQLSRRETSMTCSPGRLDGHLIYPGYQYQNQ
jgi:hypothetical protein